MRTSEAPPKAFISYSRSDLALASWLHARLERHGQFDVLRDLEDTEPGEDWWNRVVALIRQCDAVVLILSKQSSQSETCTDEIKEAVALGKRIVPLVIEKTDWKLLPLGLARIHSIEVDTSSEAGKEQGVLALEQALKRDIVWVRIHTIIGEAALRWADRGKRSADLLRGSALVEGEQWFAKPAKDSSAPTDLHRAFLAASRRSVRFRRRIGLSAIAAALLMVSVAAFAALFYNADARLNTAQLALQDGAIVDAQSAVLDWSEDWLTKVAPVTNTASTLATRLLDNGLVLDSVDPRLGDNNLTPTRMRMTRSSLFVLYVAQTDERYATRAMLLKCGRDLSNCVRANVPGTQYSTFDLVADNDRVFLARIDSDRVPTIFDIDWKDNSLRKVPLDELPIKRTDYGYLWETANDANDFTSSELVSEGSRLRPILQGVTSTEKQIATGEQPISGAACDQQLLLCVVSMPADRPGNVVRFDVWRYGDQDGAVTWRRSAQSLYAPPLSNTTMAIVADGSAFAIAADDVVNVWDARTVLRGNTRLSRNFRLSGDVGALAYSADGTSLYGATPKGIYRIALFPRGSVVAEAEASTSSWLNPQESDWEEVKGSSVFDERLTVVGAEEICRLDFGDGAALRLVAPLPQEYCLEGEPLEVNVVAEDRSRALLLLTSAIGSAKLTQLVLASFDGTIVHLRSVQTNDAPDVSTFDRSSVSLAADKLDEIYLRDDGLKTRRFALSAGLADLLRAEEPGDAPAYKVASGVYVFVLSSNGCATAKDPASGLDTIGSKILLASAASDQVLRADYYVKCVPGVAAPYDADRFPTLIPEQTGRRVFIGTHTLPGVIEWDVPAHSLVFHNIAGKPKASILAGAPAEGREFATASLENVSLTGEGVTAGAYDAQLRLLAFYSATHSIEAGRYSVDLYHIERRTVESLDAPSVETSDYVQGMSFNPAATLILVEKSVSGPMLFRVRDRLRLPLPSGIGDAAFVGDDWLRFTFKNGMVMCWRVPEGSGAEVAGLLAMLQRRATGMPPGCSAR